MLLILLFAAPILQIILSILRVLRIIGIRLCWIAAITLLLGLMLPFVSMAIVSDELSVSHPGMHCGMPAFGALVAGTMITLIATPVVALIFYLIDRICRCEVAYNLQTKF